MQSCTIILSYIISIPLDFCCTCVSFHTLHSLTTPMSVILRFWTLPDLSIPPFISFCARKVLFALSRCLSLSLTCSSVQSLSRKSSFLDMLLASMFFLSRILFFLASRRDIGCDCKFYICTIALFDTAISGSGVIWMASILMSVSCSASESDLKNE